MASTQPTVVAGRRVDPLCYALNDLREDFGALVTCLEMAGVMRKPQLHATRFQKTLERYPLGEGTHSMTDVLDSGMLRTILQMCGGEREEILAVRETTSASKAMVDEIQAERLYVFNGVDAWQCNPLRTAESFDPCTGGWSPLPSAAFPRVGCVAGVLRGRVYLCGGVGDRGQIIECFNPRRQEWETTSPAPRLSTPRCSAAAVAVNGRLYVCGGEAYANDAVHSSVEYFDPISARCEELPAMMRAPRNNLAAAALLGEDTALVVCGGCSAPPSLIGSPGARRALETAEMLNLSGGSSAWQDLAPMSTPRQSHAAVALHGSVYAIGGYDGLGLDHSGVERFDLQDGSWFPLPPMSVPRVGLVAGAVCGRIFVVGGQTWGVAAFRDGERFDTLRHAWGPAASLEHGRCYHCAAVVKVGALAV